MSHSEQLMTIGDSVMKPAKDGTKQKDGKQDDYQLGSHRSSTMRDKGPGPFKLERFQQKR